MTAGATGLLWLLAARAAFLPAAVDLSEPVAVLAAAGPATTEAELAAALDALRTQGPVARAAGPALAALLSERSALYQERGPREVARLRFSLLATLAEIGPPPEALPAILAELVHGHRPAVRAAAARAAGALGATAAVPYLVQVLEPATHDDVVSLGPAQEPTGVRIEAVRALARIGPAAREAAATLEAIGAAPPGSFYARVTGLQDEARRALEAIAAATAQEGPDHCEKREPALASHWKSPAERRAHPLAGLTASDHDGLELPLSRLAGQPLALTFFYTRCDNPNKCPLTMARLAGLQSALRKAGLADRVRLAGVTLDPELDSPGELRRFGEGLGMRPGPQAMLLNVPRANLDRLLADLHAAVSYGAGRVSVHGIQLFLLDRDGRYVRDYHDVVWDQAAVIADLRRLAAE
jgi:cytochrome oxidase Cu insertion factor (SCO1/SenC/PrrC family)